VEYKIAKFRTQDLVLIASIAVVLVLMELISTAIEAYTVVGGKLVYLIDAMFMMIVVFIVRKFGTLIIGGLLAGILALPLPIFFIPGLHNIPLLMISAFLGDVTLYFFGRWERLAAFLAPGLVIASNAVIFLLFLKFMGLPLYEETLKLMPIALPFGILLGGTGGLLGYKVYKRIEHKPFVKRVQG
jgi:hypothetical protein